MPGLSWRARARLRLGLSALLMIGGAALAAAPGPDDEAGDETAFAAAKDLPAGHRLADSDLRAVSLSHPPPAAPGRMEELRHRTLVAPIAAGEIVTTTRLLIRREGDHGAPGQSVMPVSLASDQLAALLEPGQLVDVVWAPTSTGMGPSGRGEAEVVVRGARVVAGREAAAETGPFATGATRGSSVVLLSLTQVDALAVARAQATGELTVLLTDG